MSKGSQRRPMTVSQDQFDKNWDAIFGKQDDSPDINMGESVVKMESMTPKSTTERICQLTQKVVGDIVVNHPVSERDQVELRLSVPKPHGEIEMGDTHKTETTD